MTREEFLAALRQTPRDWRLTEEGWIRRGVGIGSQCPVTALEDRPVRDWVVVGWRLRDAGMTDKGLGEILNAADNARYPDGTPWHSPILRKELLDACGLKEQQ